MRCIAPQFSLSSVTQSCLTLCNPMDYNTPDLLVYHQLLEFTQTHVHRVRDAIQPSHPIFATNWLFLIWETHLTYFTLEGEIWKSKCKHTHTHIHIYVKALIWEKKRELEQFFPQQHAPPPSTGWTFDLHFCRCCFTSLHLIPPQMGNVRIRTNPC